MSNTSNKSTFCFFSIVLIVFISGSSFASEQPFTDIDIQRAISIELSTDESIADHLIDVNVKDGFVTLSGSVDNLLSKEWAEQLCYGIKGVRGIVNRIDVMPLKRGASEIYADVSMALMQFPVTELLELTSKVRGDTVYLGGTVQSITEKQLTEEVVKGVRGVRYIVDRIKVIPTSKRSNREIKEEIKGLLETDPFLYAKMVKVDVNKGIVGLSGTVGSYAEKMFARLDAYVAGVTAVYDSGVTVKLWAKDPLRSEGRLTIKPDSTIIREMKTLFRRDPRIAPFDIGVEMNKGTVTLTGNVGTLDAKQQAKKTALNLIGVYAVDNKIKVRPAIHLGDLKLKEKVDAHLQHDPFVDRHEFNVIVRNGKVFVYGVVDNRYERKRVNDIVGKIRGVVTVANYIDVRDNKKPWMYESDSIIHDKIIDEYRHQFIIDLSDLNVSVKNGVATVTGTIESAAELHAIVQHALDSGAKMVVTRLMFNGMQKYGAYDYRDKYLFN